MSVDREQVRTICERAMREEDTRDLQYVVLHAGDTLALLAELEQAERKLEIAEAWADAEQLLGEAVQRAEQAERERDEAERNRVEARSNLAGYKQLLADAEARLSRVPALVDDAIQLCDQHISEEQRKETQHRIIEWATAWEQE